MEVRAVVDHKSKTVDKNATYLDVVETILSHDGQVGVACATVKAVKTVETTLRRRGVPVLAIHGKDSEDDKNFFTRMFGLRREERAEADHANGAEGPNWPLYKAFLYSPTITGGLSNHTCSLQLGILSKHGPMGWAASSFHQPSIFTNTLLGALHCVSCW